MIWLRGPEGVATKPGVIFLFWYNLLGTKLSVSYERLLPQYKEWNPPMLVLTRKVGESIQINDDVKITVIEVKGKNIRIGIDAPKTTKVYREEVFLKIKEENKTASSTPAGFDPEKITNFIANNLKK